MSNQSRMMALAAAVTAIALAACGGTDKPSGSTSTTEADATTTTAQVTTTAARPSYRILSEPELTSALLTVQALPAGYSQDAPAEQGPNKTFCDYKPPFTESIRVRRDFTKGGGLSSEVLSTGLRQYATPEQAKGAFDAMIDALKTCTTETYEGKKLMYSPMSAPKVGDAAVGVKINVDGTDLLQFFALVGPTLINGAGGGLMNASADDVIALLGAQVEAYKKAAAS